MHCLWILGDQQHKIEDDDEDDIILQYYKYCIFSDEMMEWGAVAL